MIKYEFEYDIALSFAGEEREYVEIVAGELKKQDIKVFYDQYEKTNMWGKNIYEYLAEVYSKKSLFCVIFISEEYAKKIWTHHELKSALSRAIRQKEEYILPAKFDDTEITGFEDVSYIDLKDYSPYKFAELVIDKIKKSDINNLEERLMNYIPTYKKFNYRLEYKEISILTRLDESRVKHQAINKISLDLGEEKEFVRSKLELLKDKGLVDLVDRPAGKKWIITFDGREYLKYYYHELDESSGA